MFQHFEHIRSENSKRHLNKALWKFFSNLLYSLVVFFGQIFVGVNKSLLSLLSGDLAEVIEFSWQKWDHFLYVGSFFWPLSPTCIFSITIKMIKQKVKVFELFRFKQFNIL
jgi:hypothetical protein